MLHKEAWARYTRRVLVVDDSPFFLGVAADLLRRDQVDVLTASRAEQGLELARAQRPDLVLMDLYMEGGDGDEACRRLKQDEELRRIPVVMMSSNLTVQARELCLQAGCDALLSKPLEREALREVLQRHARLPAWSGQRVALRAPVSLQRPGEAPQAAILGDLGLGGAFIETAAPKAIGTEAELVFRLPEGSGEKLQMAARVAWLDAGRGMGVTFVSPSQLNLLAIRNWLEENWSAEKPPGAFSAARSPQSRTPLG